MFERLRSPGDERLQSLFQRPPREQHATPAGKAAQSNVCPDADYKPIVRSARMWFPQANDIIDEERDRLLEDHVDSPARSFFPDQVRPGIFMPPVSALILSSASVEAFSMAS